MKPWCPTCGSDYPVLLGRLGRHVWYRCRYCGLDFYTKAIAGEHYYDSVSDHQADNLADWEPDETHPANYASDAP